MKKCALVFSFLVAVFLVFCQSAQQKGKNYRSYIHKNALFNIDTKAVSPIKNALFNAEKCQATPWPGLLANGRIQMKAMCPLKDDPKYYKKVQLITRTMFVTETVAKDAAISYYMYIRENADKQVAKLPKVLEPNKINAHVKGGLVTHVRFDKDYNCELIYTVPIRGITISGKEYPVLTKELQKKIAGRFAFASVPEYDHRFFYSVIAADRILVKAFAPASDMSRNPLKQKYYSQEAAEVSAQQRMIVLLKGESLNFDYGRFSSSSGGMISGGEVLDTKWDDKNNCQIIMYKKRKK